jgi:hypothetical protein
MSLAAAYPDAMVRFACFGPTIEISARTSPATGCSMKAMVSPARDTESEPIAAGGSGS